VKRCPWPGEDPVYVSYHDDEWGVPVRDDRALFEKLVLDGFQAGLSWIIILRKRDGFRQAFDGFDPEKIARYGARDLRRLQNDAGIVRNRQKIEATRDNARAWMKIRERDGDGGFSRLLWSFVGDETRHNRWTRLSQLPAETPSSRAMSKALQAEGMRFVGPTICYAFMQAVGMVDDHLVSCFRHDVAWRAAKPRSPTPPSRRRRS
jgi:DNA-3-methyladenine glycosylase I